MKYTLVLLARISRVQNHLQAAGQPSKVLWQRPKAFFQQFPLFGPALGILLVDAFPVLEPSPQHLQGVDIVEVGKAEPWCPLPATAQLQA